MNTLIIVASLFSVQPAPAQFDSQWLDLQSMREQVRAYVVEDVSNVSDVIYTALREGISAGSKLVNQQSDSATLMAQQEQAADNAVEQTKFQVN